MPSTVRKSKYIVVDNTRGDDGDKGIIDIMMLKIAV